MDIMAYRAAAVKAVRWLLAQQNPDGSIHPVEQGLAAYYKVPYAFSLGGRSAEAVKLLAWVRDNVLTEEGDFVGPYPRQGPHTTYYHYPNSWLVAGAHRLGQFQVSVPGAEFLVTMQHPQSGGFLTGGPDATLNSLTDMMSTSLAGLACLYTGHLEQALAVGGFLRHVWDSQPSPANTLYFCTHNGAALVTDSSGDELVARAIDARTPRQWYFEAGLAAVFLARLYMATADQKHLSYAQQYIEFVERCADDRYRTPQSGKVGWAAALLFALTGNANWQRIAAAVADYLVASQQEDGSWQNPAVGTQLAYATVDVTAEFAIILCEIAEGLMAGE